MEDGNEVRHYGWIIGALAGVIALLQVLIAGSAASSYVSETLALQRAFIVYRDGTGGPLIDPQIERLVFMFVVTYCSVGLTLLLLLGFSWYAGRIVASAKGQPSDGARAGRLAAWVSWLLWCTASLLAIVCFRADSTLSWLVASAFKLTFTPESAPITGMYVTAPDGVFLTVQVGAFLLQAGAGLAVALYLGGIAGQVGATWHGAHVTQRWTIMSMRSRLRAAIGATRARVLRSRGK